MDAIKLEGGVRIVGRIRAITDAGVNVIGHIGLTPQSSGQLGGHKAQGRTAETAKMVVEDALAVQEAGAKMLLVEAVPPEVMKYIWETLTIPVLSIGAGPHCDGQLLIVIEIAGVERASTMEAMIKAAEKRGLIIHRAIATVGGSTYCDFQELRDMAEMAKDAGIEMITTVGHRKGWDTGSKEISTSEGQMQGFRLRGSDHISYHIADIMRNIEAGHRGFLVYDEGVLFILNKMRDEGVIPAETIFKFSVFGGYCSAAGAKVIESMGANSMNPISDVSLPILGGIRKTVDIPLDVYIIIVDSFGGMFRAYESPEIARVASPCYFKFEPGTSEGDIYKPWMTEDFHVNLIQEKVKIASIVMEIMTKHAPELKTSGKGPEDLVLPLTV